MHETLHLLGFDHEGRHPGGLVAQVSIRALFSIHHVSRPHEKFFCNTPAEIFSAALMLAETQGRAAGHDAVFRRFRELLEA